MAVLESQWNMNKSPYSVNSYNLNEGSVHESSLPISFTSSNMGSSSNFIISLLFIGLLLLLEQAVAEDISSGFHGDERDALTSLKIGFNNSVLLHNWTGIMCYMNNTPYWIGVQCLNGRVTGLILENMNLTGEIKTDAISNLTELSTLSFKNNSISGNLMDFTNNQKLTKIDLSGNNFNGEISPSLLSLNFLESLHLQDNSLTGKIPGFNQTALKSFNVSYNNLSRKIPRTETLQSFNISSYIGNEHLCGPPTPKACSNNKIRLSNSSNESSGNNSSKSSHFVAFLVVADVIVLVVILFLFIIYYKKYKKLKQEMRTNNLFPKSEDHDSRILERSMEKRTPDGDRTPGRLVFMENMESRFELSDLLKASAEGLGKGNFGNCYKATLEVGRVVVVKRLRDLKPLGSEEFVRQVKAIAEQKHPNLLPILAYYHSKDEKLLLYRFAAHGNLFNRLHGGRDTRDRVPFRWNSRLAVARAVARALEHLHSNTRSETTAPHGNLKSSNVLLDENEEILVADYGLHPLISLPIAAQRMICYKTPEYQSSKRICKRSDVWSYGSLVLEILTGKIPMHSAPPGTNGVDLCAWVHRAVREEWTAEIFDEEIAVQKGANHGMLRLMQIAMKCCDKTPEKRPEIGQVAAEVEEIKFIGGESDEDYSYSSMDRSLTDDSHSGNMSIMVIGDEQR